MDNFWNGGTFLLFLWIFLEFGRHNKGVDGGIRDYPEVITHWNVRRKRILARRVLHVTEKDPHGCRCSCSVFKTNNYQPVFYHRKMRLRVQQDQIQLEWVKELGYLFLVPTGGGHLWITESWYFRTLSNKPKLCQMVLWHFSRKRTNKQNKKHQNSENLNGLLMKIK